MKKRGNWTVKSTKTVYQTPWIKVYEDEVIRPDGKDGIFTTVDIKPGVTVLPVDSHHNVYLSESFQYALNKKIIGPACGGGIEDGEDPLSAAKRELKEETGLTAKRWTPLGTAHDIVSSVISAPNYMFLAEDLRAGESKWDGGEDVRVYKVPLRDAVKMVLEGRITHAVAQTIILKAFIWIRRTIYH